MNAALSKLKVDPAKIISFLRFKDGIYNKAVNLPPALCSSFVGKFTLVLSDHAVLAANNDRYGFINLPANPLDVKLADIVEVSVARGKAFAALLRLSHDEQNHLCIPVVHLEGRPGYLLAKTCWLNQKGDNHSKFNSEYSANLAA